MIRYFFTVLASTLSIVITTVLAASTFVIPVFALCVWAGSPWGTVLAVVYAIFWICTLTAVVVAADGYEDWKIERERPR